MAQFTLGITSTSPVTPVYGYRICERGIIRSVACDFFTFLYPSAAALVEVGTMVGGRGIEYITSVFFSGYFWVGNMGSWVGYYPVEPSEEIFVRAYSFGTVPIRIVGKIEIGDP